MKFNFAQFSQKITNSIFILSIRQAFIALLPYNLLMAFLVLSYTLLMLIPDWSGGPLINWLSISNQVMQALFPVVIVIAVSYYLSLNIGVNTLASSVLATSCFVSNSGYLTHTDAGSLINAQNATLYVILIPALTTYLLSYLIRIKWINIVEGRFSSAYLIRHINLIIPFFLIFFLCYAALPASSDAVYWLRNSFTGSGSETPNAINTFLKWHFLVHGLWFLGIHGYNVTSSLIDVQIFTQPILPGISGTDIIEKFTNLGGSGAMMGFVLATLWCRRDAQLQQIGKLSLPFAIFNINEIPMYGVPIVLNPYFLLPFLLCPLVNFFISYFAIGYGLIPVNGAITPWVTPVLIGGYFMGGPVTALFQLALILLDALIYTPFIHMYVKANSKRDMLEQLTHKLAVKPSIQTNRAKDLLPSFELQNSLQPNKELRQIVDEITNGELLLYYHPQIDNQGYCRGIEALLRLRKKDGSILKPYFLTELEKAGFANAIDWWVVDKLMTDLKLWQQGNPGLFISLNLHASTLGNNALVSRLIESFEPYQGLVEIEILETAYIAKFSTIFDNVEKLKRHGIHTAMDDFGTGFSSLSLLYKLNVRTIKLDRYILKNADNPKGEILYTQLYQLCKKLGFRVIAEGIETEQQAKFVSKLGIELTQGWLYSSPLPLEQAMAFVQHTNFIAKPPSVHSPFKTPPPLKTAKKP